MELGPIADDNELAQGDAKVEIFLKKDGKQDMQICDQGAPVLQLCDQQLSVSDPDSVQDMHPPISLNCGFVPSTFPEINSFPLAVRHFP